MKVTFRLILITASLVLLWQAIVLATGAPPFILPGPADVALALVEKAPLLVGHAGVTFAEIGLGLGIGILLGAGAALAMAYLRGLEGWVLPVLVASQAVPVFALAPVLVLWFGYGMASKVAMAVLIIFFPVTAAFYDGLRQTNGGLAELSRSMDARPFHYLLRVRIPHALPSLASGIRVAAAVAPIGAVVGEWVGSEAGLGHLMLHANARMQIDTMFAALTVLAVGAIALYLLVDRILKRTIWWAGDTNAS